MRNRLSLLFILVLGVLCSNGEAFAQSPIDTIPVFDFSTSPAARNDAALGSQTPSPVMPAMGDLRLDPRQESPISKRQDVIVTGGMLPQADGQLVPFGSQIFAKANMVDRSIGVNSNYIISAGDRIAIKVWGARNYENVQPVDLQGNIFLPEVGSIKVEGITKGLLNKVVRQHFASVFTNNVNVYTNLLGTQPISVYVTGAVNEPGLYPGSKQDSILYYLSRAGAIDSVSGSYRRIKVLRDGQELATIDLYRFLLLGELPKIDFKSGDTVLVEPQGDTVSVTGAVKNSYIFEINTLTDRAGVLLTMAQPNPKASYSHISGVRDGKMYADYQPLELLEKRYLKNGDVIEIVEDQTQRNLTISVVGNSNGPSSFVVPNTARLGQAFRLIEVEPQIADIGSIYLRRASVAKRQKDAIQRSLYELQRSVLTGSSSTQREASIRVQEAKLVENFVKTVMAVEPEGRVVLVNNPNWKQVSLEAGDEIVIPRQSDVVVISGEVKMPLTILWDARLTAQDYIQEAGGVSNRGDVTNILVLKRNGSVHTGIVPIEKGDHIIVLPKDDVKHFAMFQDIIEMVYRVAISSAVIINALK